MINLYNCLIRSVFEYSFFIFNLNPPKPGLFLAELYSNAQDRVLNGRCYFYIEKAFSLRDLLQRPSPGFFWPLQITSHRIFNLCCYIFCTNQLEEERKSYPILVLLLLLTCLFNCLLALQTFWICMCSLSAFVCVA